MREGTDRHEPVARQSRSVKDKVLKMSALIGRCRHIVPELCGDHGADGPMASQVSASHKTGLHGSLPALQDVALILKESHDGSHDAGYPWMEGSHMKGFHDMGWMGAMDGIQPAW